MSSTPNLSPPPDADDVIAVACRVFHLLDSAYSTLMDAYPCAANGERSFHLDHSIVLIDVAMRLIAPVAMEDVDRRRDN